MSALPSQRPCPRPPARTKKRCSPVSADRTHGALGVRYDSTTGLYYMRARWYDSSLQRFISRDPKGLKGGVNLYQYASANPVSYIDPNGTDIMTLGGLAAAAYQLGQAAAAVLPEVAATVAAAAESPVVIPAVALGTAAIVTNAGDPELSGYYVAYDLRVRAEAMGEGDMPRPPKVDPIEVSDWKPTPQAGTQGKGRQPYTPYKPAPPKNTDQRPQPPHPGGQGQHFCTKQYNSCKAGVQTLLQHLMNEDFQPCGEDTKRGIGKLIRRMKAGCEIQYTACKLKYGLL